MMLSRIRIKRTMRGEDAGAWTRALVNPAWLAGAKVLKDEPGSSWVRRATLNGRNVVVKCRLLNTPSRRLKAALGFGHGDKHWRGAALLAAKKIPTARPIIHAHARVDGAPSDLLVLEYLDGPTLLDVLNKVSRGDGPPVRLQHAIAAATGRSVTGLLRACLWNRDHKPSNLIVLGIGDGRPEIAVIDCVGLKRYGRLGIDEMESEEMGASLVIEPSGVGCRPRKALWMRALRAMLDDRVLSAPRSERRADLRVVIAAIEAIVASHGDPRPKSDPLAPLGVRQEYSPPVGR